MKHLCMAALAVLLLPASQALAQDKARAFRFGKADVDKLPTGWQAAHTNEGGKGAWKVVADDSTPSKSGLALAQVGSSPSKVFNLCIATGTRYQDVEIEVAFKAVSGEIDQGGGVVWRYQDPKNYYIARANPLEENYRVYKVVDGSRKQLGTKENVKMPDGQWHRIKVRHVGDRIECYLDGKKLLDAQDNELRQAGQVGLWTKADARTRFDGLRVAPPARKD
ncbi:MAG: DUF1080 domain-containing protein [Gemmataceae bacterium]|nr:DUF1080 domain-containing protein [Gemmataceae bacterium]